MLGKKICRMTSAVLTALMLLTAMVACGNKTAPQNTENTEQQIGGPMTNFVTSSIVIDKMLERPYEGFVPTAFSEVVFALHSSGWGYDDDTLFVTGDASGHGLSVNVSVDGLFVRPNKATWRPSHVVSSYTYDSSAKINMPEQKNTVMNLAPYAEVSASYTSLNDADGLKHLVDGIKSYNNNPRNRWTNYVSGGRANDDSVVFTYDYVCDVSSVKVYPYNDGGATVLPQKISIEYLDNGEWKPVTNAVGGDKPVAVLNTITFDTVRTSKIKVVFTPRPGKSLGATEIEVIGKVSSGVNTDASGITVNETKFITVDHIVACMVEVKNDGTATRNVSITASPSTKGEEVSDAGFYILAGGDKAKTVSLAAGESVSFCTAMAYSENAGENQSKIDALLNDGARLDTHVDHFMKWFEDNVPYFDCDDEELLQTYYFRWLTYRNHIRRISDGWDGYIISEFLTNVRWAGAYNSISCAAGHHLYEGRWIKDSKYLDSYQKFWFTEVAEPRRYSFAVADAYYARYLVSSDKNNLTQYLDGLISNYDAWSEKYSDKYGLYRQIADRDGMEYGIGGDGYRPTINSYMYGDAVAISKIASLAGNEELASQFDTKASTLRTTVLEKLWNDEHGFFESLNYSGNSVNVREEIGYVPWYYNLPEDNADYASAFAQLLDTQGFKSEYGPTTAEQRHPRFMKSQKSICTWDGPSWPFATSQTLTAAANLLNNYENNDTFTKGDWFDLIKTYAHTHYKDGYSWLAESLNGITGDWIADRDISIHYNHSTFNDLIITGLVGLRPDSAEGQLVINPLVTEEDMKYFVLENVAFRGRNITVVYDRDGSRYGQGAGLRVYVDGKLAAESATLSSVTVNINA